MLSLGDWQALSGSLVRYRAQVPGREEAQCTIEAMLEGPIRHLSSQNYLQNGSYVISNRGMERLPLYQENQSTNIARRSTPQTEPAGLLSLSYEVHLRILSHLDAKSLCRIARTCRRLNRVAEDEFLWKQRLTQDSHQWLMVGHLSHPSIHRQILPDVDTKIVYDPWPLSKVKQVWMGVTQKITGGPDPLKWIMFGGGLDRYSIDKKLFFASDAPYAISSLYPGRDGFGSGIGFTLNRDRVNLVTLYASTRHERRAAAAGRGPQVNKLVSLYNEGDPSGSELTHSVRELCPTAHAYVLVVNAGKPELSSDQWMLTAFLKHTSPSTPVLVLSCCHDNTSDQHAKAAVEVATELCLPTLPNPWQVLSLGMNELTSISQGFEWLLRHQN